MLLCAIGQRDDVCTPLDAIGQLDSTPIFMTETRNCLSERLCPEATHTSCVRVELEPS